VVIQSTQPYKKKNFTRLLVVLKDCKTGVQSPSSYRKLSTSFLVKTLNPEFIKTLKAPEAKPLWTKSLGS
jgi:hypothetical protein